ncbi:hypothetical protein ACHAXT_012952 [Thalassiosira profunda]
MAADLLEPSEGGQLSPGQLSPGKRPTIPTIKGSTIHSLGRGSLGRINRKYPSLNVVNRGAANADTGVQDKASEEDSAKITTEEGVQSGDSPEQGGHNDQEEGEGNIDSGRTSFNALMSKWGGKSKGKKPASKEDEEPNTTDGSTPAPVVQAGEEAPVASEETTSSPGKVRKMASFLKAKGGGKKPSSTQEEGPTPSGGEVPAPSFTDEEAPVPSPALGRVQQMSAFLKTPSFSPKAKTKNSKSPKETEERDQTPPEPVSSSNNKEDVESLPSSIQYTIETKDAGGPKKTKGAPAKQNKGKPKPSSLRKLSQLQPQPQGRNKSSKPDIPQSKRSSLVQPKSRQQLVLEKVAARYLLKNGQTTARYTGVTDYGDGGGGVLGNIDENTDGSSRLHSLSKSTAPLGLDKTFTNRDRDALVLFLEGNVSRRNSEDGSTDTDPKSLSIITEVSSSSGGSSSKKSAPPDIHKETDIDRILEIASDHLSLGRNESALQAYRRAMKCAFADVLSVKQKLTDVKQRQVQGGMDGAELELTRQEERQFGMDLLRVASRVADIHNNMGVVFEMDRQFDKARTSYVDALEVYHNTCQRFEEKGDADVDRTKMNVERMSLACKSEERRRALHEKAARTAKRGQMADFSQRQKFLREAIATLNKALEMEGETIGLTHPVAAQTLIKQGKFHYEIREYDAACSEIRRAISILRNALGGNHPQVGKSILLLASIYERHGMDISPEGTNKDDSELELYVDALEPLKATLGETHKEVGLLYIKIGYLYGKKGDQNLSLLAYKAALKAFGEPLSSANGGAGVNLEVVSIWVRVTEHLATLNAWDDLVVAGRRALFLLRRSKQTLRQPGSRASKKSPILITSDTYDEALFTTLQCLGQAHTSLAEYSSAGNALSESLQLAWDRALSKNSSTSKEEGRSKSIVQLIRALKRLGKAYLLEKQYARALECFLPSLELLRSNEKMESTLDCASVLGSLGFLYLKLQRYPEARNFLKECLRLYEKNGVSATDRETRKIKSWLEMAEAREEEDGGLPPSLLEIPTIVFQEE